MGKVRLNPCRLRPRLSQLELAWDNYRWGENVFWGTQEWFCREVAEMNKLEYLVWLREVKNCDWDHCAWNRRERFGDTRNQIKRLKWEEEFTIQSLLLYHK
jgi:hypothetical protein